MRRSRHLLAIAGLTLVFLMLAGACGGRELAAVDRLREAGRVRVGFADEPPYAYLDAKGDLVGSEVAVAKEIFERLGLPQIEPVRLPFGDLVAALEDGRVDVVVAGMFITPDRCARVAFSNPTYAAPEVLAVPPGNPLGLTRYRDILEAGATVGVLDGSVEAEHARGAGIAEEHVVRASDPAKLVALLRSGAIDAFALTSLAVRSLQSTAGTEHFDVTAPFIPIVNDRPAVGAGAFAFRLGDAPFRDAVDVEIRRLREEGLFDALMEPYGFQSRELVPAASLTATELCAVPTGG